METLLLGQLLSMEVESPALEEVPSPLLSTREAERLVPEGVPDSLSSVRTSPSMMMMLFVASRVARRSTLSRSRAPEDDGDEEDPEAPASPAALNSDMRRVPVGEDGMRRRRRDEVFTERPRFPSLPLPSLLGVAQSLLGSISAFVKAD